VTRDRTALLDAAENPMAGSHPVRPPFNADQRIADIVRNAAHVQVEERLDLRLRWWWRQWWRRWSSRALHLSGSSVIVLVSELLSAADAYWCACM